MFSKKLEIYYCYNWNSLTHNFLYPLINKLKSLQSIQDAHFLMPNSFPNFEKNSYDFKEIKKPFLWVPIPCLKNPSRTLYIAKALQNFWGGTVYPLLEFKTFSEKEQKRKKRSDRKNRRFRVLVTQKRLDEIIKKYDIILVDDIVTTGFTMENCLLALNLNRAYGWCFAYKNKNLE